VRRGGRLWVASNLTKVETMVIREHPSKLVESDNTYVVWICAEERVDGTWEGWLEFHPNDVSQPILRTDQETSQPNRAAIKYWADGLEPIYLEGALARAQGR
jgi:hypothetical protein